MSTLGVPADHPLTLDGDIAVLTERIIALESVSGGEKPLADAVESALRALPGLTVHRDGDAVVARTETGAQQRVVLAGHLDTVPLPTRPGSRGTVPPQWEGDVLYGRGAVDMKGGVAVQLQLAAEVAAALSQWEADESLRRDITWVFYDHEEVAAEKSGLGRVLRNSPELLEADFGVLLEPTDGVVEGGCNGTARYRVTVAGTTAHSGRAWMGRNAIHAVAPLLTALEEYSPKTVDVDGLAYREGLNAVRISAGIAGNVIPDACTVEINYRFAPDKTEEQAHAHVAEVLSRVGISADAIEITDTSASARPGLDHPAAASFVAAVGGEPKPKYGWTDVARLSAVGVPAVNFGPGSALLAHTDDEHVHAQSIRDCHSALRRWLLG